MGKDNQKTIKALHKEKCDANHLYSCINLDAMNAAALALEAGAFKLWVYFAKNSAAYKNWELSSKAVQNSFGIKKKQYDNAMKELIEKGYLVSIDNPTNAAANEWEFFEIPRACDEKAQVTERESATCDEKEQGLVSKSNNPCDKKEQALCQKVTTNIINNKSNTIDTTSAKKEEQGMSKAQYELLTYGRIMNRKYTPSELGF